MGGYIRIDKDQVEDQRLFDAAARLAQTWRLITSDPDLQPLSDNDNCHAMCHALLGVTVTLWSYADTHINADNSLHVTLPGLAAKLGAPVTMLEAIPKRWLRVREDGFVELPGYCEKNHINARDLRREERNEELEQRRASDAERQRRHRQKKKEERHAVTVTKKSRDSVTVTPPTGPGPGSLRPNPGPESEKNPETPTQHDALASAQGHLARRVDAGKRGAEVSKTNGHGGEAKGVSEPNGARVPAHSPEELQAFAYRLADQGNQSEDIAKMLGQHGVTGEQVRKWLSNRQPPPAEGTA